MKTHRRVANFRHRFVACHAHHGSVTYELMMNVYAISCIKAYLEAAILNGTLPMFYLELVSGLRKGELVALFWSNVDTAHNTIFVSKQYVRNPLRERVLS